MPGGFREFLKTKAGRMAAFAGAVLALIIFAYAMYGFFGPNEAEAVSATRTFVDASTGKPFKVTLEVGMPIPCKAPSGNMTGYPAELCYWTKDGKIKDSPTAVLLNETVGKTGPTFCPDCGRLVIGHNPQPKPGKNPPPTEAEYKSRNRGASPPPDDRDRRQ